MMGEYAEHDSDEAERELTRRVGVLERTLKDAEKVLDALIPQTRGEGPSEWTAAHEDGMHMVLRVRRVLRGGER